MTKRNLFMGGGAVALGLGLIALPSPPAHSQEPADAKVAQMEQKIESFRRAWQSGSPANRNKWRSV